MRPERARDLLAAEEARLRDLRDTAQARLSESLRAETGELSTFDQHPADVGTETQDRERDESMVRSLDAELREIDDARRRLAEDRYGRCERCGEPIPDERLEVQPHARYCVRHQREAERRAGTPGA